jgi:hypothetical protein
MALVLTCKGADVVTTIKTRPADKRKREAIRDPSNIDGFTGMCLHVWLCG